MSVRVRRGGVDLGAAATVAGVVIVALAGGLWILMRAGNPFPTTVPSLDTLGKAIGQGQVSDTVLIKTVTLFGWVLWLELVASLVSEAVALLRGTTAVRIPFAGPIQHLAARALATALFAGATIIVRPLSTSAAVRSTAPEPLSMARDARGPRVTVLRDSSSAEACAGPSYTVQRRDTLWGIAQHCLGNPERWPEVLALNVDKVQCDGCVLRSADDQLQPGWVLQLPSGAVTADAPAPTRAPAGVAPSTIIVAPDDTLWDLAQHHLGDPLRWPEIFELNRNQDQPDGRRLTNPNLILPGWALHLPGAITAPATPTPPPTAAPTPATPVSPASRPTDRAPRPPQPAPAHTAKAPPRDDQHRNVLPGLAGATLLVTGLLAALTRLRRHQQRHRKPGTELPRLDDAAAATEVVLRTAETSDAAWLDTTLRALGATLRDTPAFADIRPVAAHLSQEFLELFFDPPCVDAPPGWQSVGDGQVWQLERNAAPAALATTAGAASPMPALVTIGCTPLGPLLLDVEACGAVSISGTDDEVRGFLASLTLELCTSRLADAIDVVVAGDNATPWSDHTSLEHLGRLRVATREEALDELRQRAVDVAEALTGEGMATTLWSRVEQRELFPPLVVIADALPGVEELDLDGGTGVCVVGRAAARVGGWHLEFVSGVLRVPRLGLTVAPIALTRGEVSDVLRLFDHATLEPTATTLLPDEPRPDLAEGFVEAPFEVEVRVLGEVEIAGGLRQLPPRAVELVTLLATHPEGLTEQQVKTALWPDHIPAPSTWVTRVSEARKGLGRARDGEHFFPYLKADGRYRLSSLVVTDLARLEARLAFARRAEPRQAVPVLERALQCVRGAPVRVDVGYSWAHSEGLASRAEIAVADTAHLLAELLLDAGDAHATLEVVAAALRASPGNEVLYRDRMRAHDRLGDRGGVEHALQELLQAIESHDPNSDLHPETLELLARIGRSAGNGR